MASYSFTIWGWSNDRRILISLSIRARICFGRSISFAESWAISMTFTAAFQKREKTSQTKERKRKKKPCKEMNKMSKKEQKKDVKKNEQKNLSWGLRADCSKNRPTTTGPKFLPNNPIRDLIVHVWYIISENEIKGERSTTGGGSGSGGFGKALPATQEKMVPNFCLNLEFLF
jgi:hypothetical protein